MILIFGIHFIYYRFLKLLSNRKNVLTISFTKLLLTFLINKLLKKTNYKLCEIINEKY
jgi:hypothetical protein